MNGYELSRQWFDFAFEKKEAKVQHTALYLWIVELNNRLGWKKEFGLPTVDTMEGLSIGNKATYLSTVKDLEAWGFIQIIQEAKNQYQACIISLCYTKNDTAQVTALDTALIQHSTQHGNGIDDSIGVSTVPIVKQVNKETKKQDNNITTSQKNEKPESQDASQLSLQVPSSISDIKMLDFNGVVDALMQNDKALMYLSRAHNIKTDIDRKRIIEAFAMHLELDNKLPAKASGICQHFCFWCPKRKYADSKLFEPTILSIISQEKPTKPYMGPTDFFREQDYLKYNNEAGWSGMQIPAYRGQYNQAKEFAATMNPKYGFANA